MSARAEMLVERAELWLKNAVTAQANEGDLKNEELAAAYAAIAQVHATLALVEQTAALVRQGAPEVAEKVAWEPGGVGGAEEVIEYALDFGSGLTCISEDRADADEMQLVIPGSVVLSRRVTRSEWSVAS